MSIFTFDIEANNLLNLNSIDYTQSPYRLFPSFSVHCVVFENHATGEIIAFHDGDKYIFDGRPYKETDGKYEYILSEYESQEYSHFPMEQLSDFIDHKGVFKDKDEYKITKVLGHNIINYDLLALKLYFNIQYSVKYNTWNENNVEICDTMILSKVLNPDRFGGHSLEDLSKKAGGAMKLDFRKNIPVEDRFNFFAADMLYYCIYDNKANTAVYHYLQEEWGDYAKWKEPFILEQRVADIITRQEHRGFLFNMKQAEKNIKDLDIKMEERRIRAEPMLPPKNATKGYLKNFIPPKQQFKKADGNPSANLLKFVDKIGGVLEKDDLGIYTLKFEDKIYTLPLSSEDPICNPKVPATLNDTTHIKDWLVGLGWSPSEYKDKDITLKSGTKIKKDEMQMEKGIKDYVEQTLNSNFCADRCEHLQATPETLEYVLRARISKAKGGVKVLTNPSFTKGQDKEICPNLIAMSEAFPYAKDVVEYLTYKHRRNSILGGGKDWDDDEEEIDKGYLAAVRKDNRIPTPAATCDASTSRMKHKLVANIPRVTSLYGEEMRSLFGVDTNKYFQIGYDFDSLEARIESHYTWRYEKDPHEYCNSLLLEKPNDVHSVMAKRITETIGKKFERGPAKAVKYGCLPVDITEVLTEDGWKFRNNLKLKDKVLSYNSNTNSYEYTEITKFWDYNDAKVVSLGNKWFKVEVTEDHDWIVKQRKSSIKNGNKIKSFSIEKRQTSRLNFESNIVASAPSMVKSTLTQDEARFLGWLLSDGYFKWSGKKRNSKMGISVSLDQDAKKYLVEMRSAVSCLFDYKEYVSGSMHSIRPDKDQFRSFLNKCGVSVGENKNEFDWSKLIAQQNKDVLEKFLRAFWLGDGYTRKSGSLVIRQKAGSIADAIMLAINMTGNVVYGKTQKDGMLTLALNNGQTISGQKLKIKPERKTNVFCLTTPNESFVIRQNGFITLTGNCTYGAQAAKVAKTIGSDIYTGELVYNAFWEAAKPLALLKERLNEYWLQTGKKFILGIDGRKVPTRSAHAILNSLFQSGGVICAKRAMVIYDDYLEENDLKVDFFMDDWKNKNFSQQMIAYHDECQLEVSRDLVQIKWFSKESLNWKEADCPKEQEKINKECENKVKQWKEEEEKRTGKLWANVHESSKGGWYTAYSLAGELASKAVDAAGKYYNLNVSLTAGYDVGGNWAQCH